MTLRDEFIANLDKRLEDANNRNITLSKSDITAIQTRYDSVKTSIEVIKASGIDVDDILDHLDNILQSAKQLEIKGR